MKVEEGVNFSKPRLLAGEETVEDLVLKMIQVVSIGTLLQFTMMQREITLVRSNSICIGPAQKIAMVEVVGMNILTNR